MSKELADRFERDLSASDETAERARRARSRGAALDIDWARAFEVYYAQANLDPKKFIRFPDKEVDFPNPVVTGRDFRDVSSDDDEQYESATPR
jgi:hypothetical protein